MRGAIAVLVLVLGGCDGVRPVPVDEPFCIDDFSARCPYGDGGVRAAACSETEAAVCESGELQTCPSGQAPFCLELEP